jgi:hypothetical protein
MLSAGVEKLKSPLWQSHRGVISFLSLPHLVRKEFHFIHRLPKFLLIPLGFLVVLAETSFLVSSLYDIWFYVNLFILTSFAISLFVIVDISFIGQILVFCFSFIGYFYFSGYLNPAFELDLDVYHWDKTVVFVQVFFTLPIALTILFLFYGNAHRFPHLARLQKWLTGINTPIGVFGESHQFGFYTFKLSLQDSKEIIFAPFCEKGYPHRYQFWFPRYYQSAMYPVTDFCLSWLKYGRPNLNKEEQVKDLLLSALLSKNLSEGRVVLSVKKFDEKESMSSYANQVWAPIASASFKNNFLEEFNLLNAPPSVKKHFRKL